MVTTAVQLRREVLDSEAYDDNWMLADNFYGWRVTFKIFISFFAVITVLPFLVDAGYVISTSILGFFLVGLLAYKFSFLLHETCHYTLFASKRLNELVGTIAGYVTGTNYPMYKAIHMLHHKKNGEDGDPQQPDAMSQMDTKTGKQILLHVLSPLLFSRLLSFVSHYIPFLPESLKTEYQYQGEEELPKVHFSFYIGVAMMQVLIATLITGFFAYPLMALLYPFSAFTISLFLSRFRTCAEHMRPNAILEKDFTRSHKPNIIDQFLLYEANFNYHFEHHVFPQMPAANLPKFNKEFGSMIHDEDTWGNNSMIVSVINFIRNDGKKRSN